MAGLGLADPALVTAPNATWSAPTDQADSAPVTFYNVNTRETESFRLRFDGSIDPADEERMKHLFRCKRSGRMRSPDRGLLVILSRLAKRYPGHLFEVVSAHRARPASVRKSQHYSGHAIDLRVNGVPLTDVRSYVWQITDMPIGLGHYLQQGFLHIDHRPERERIAWTQRRKGRSYRYHPRWATLTN